MTTLYVREPCGSFTEATADHVLSSALQLAARRCRRGSPVLDAPSAVRQFLRVKFGSLEHEVFAALFVDSRHRLIEMAELFRGTLTASAVYPREVVKEALARNAAGVVLVHNHPSGTAEPSSADELITKRVREALALVDVRVLDHLIVAGDEVVSFAESGLL